MIQFYNGHIENIGKLQTSCRPICILVQLGSIFPQHIYECVDQLILFDPEVEIYIVVSDNYIGHKLRFLSNTIVHYFDDTEIISMIEKYQPTGLFTYSLARFWAIYDCMQYHNIPYCIHMEHDNMIYGSIGELSSLCNNIYGNKLSFTRDSEDRCIAGLCWIGSITNLMKMMNFFQEMNFCNFEMFLITDFLKQNEEYISTLPVIPNYSKTNLNNNFSTWNSLFDAAALGQYIGGVDVIHTSDDTRGFINETSEYKIPYTPCYWYIDDNKKCPCIKYNDKYYHVWNLHIHSKMLHLYSSYQWSNKDEFIQGRKFQNLCFNHFYGKEVKELLAKRWMKNNINIQYIKTDKLDEFIDHHWSKTITKPTIIVSHNADHGIEEKHLPYINDLNIIAWFAQNTHIDHVKLFTIPIGLANSQYQHGDTDKIINNLAYPPNHNREKGIYINFGNTHPYREQCIEQLKLFKPCIHSERKIVSEYWKDITKMMLVSSPIGNGIDTHRLWETWYAGGIPVLHDDSNLMINNLPKMNLNISDQSFDHIYKVLYNLKCYYNMWRNATGREALRMSYWSAEIYMKCHKDLVDYDVVMPLHDKDADKLNNCIYYLQKNAIGLNYIYVLTSKHIMRNHILDDRLYKTNVVFIDEKLIEPCSINELKQLYDLQHRVGWYYQQLLKLNSHKLEQLNERYVVVDSDNLFVKPITFYKWDECQTTLFHLENYQENMYRDFVQRFIPDIDLKYSGNTSVVHHMPMKKSIMNNLQSGVSLPFWKSFMDNVLAELYLFSGCSEYELYFQYVCNNYPYCIRKLRMLNTTNKKDINTKNLSKYNLISCHSYNG